MQLRNAFSLAMTTLFVIGCSSSGPILQPEGPDYESASTSPRLEVPPDLTSPEYDSSFVISGRDGRVSAIDIGRRDADRAILGQEPILPTFAGVKLREEVGVRWLEVDAAPDELWGKLRDFWRTQGLVLKRDEPSIGIMETEWAENRANIPMDPIREMLGKVLNRFYDAGLRDKFRIRVAREGERITAIFLTHKGAEEAIDRGGVVKWQMRPSDPELEAEMLRRLMVFLGRGEEESRRMIAAGGTVAPATVDVQFVSDDDHPALRIEDEPRRVWRRLGLALDRASLVVDDQDRNAGIYHVTVVEEGGEEEGGFFSRLFGRKDSLRWDTSYQIHVKPVGNVAIVTVFDREGHPAETGEAEAVLKRIQSELY